MIASDLRCLVFVCGLLLTAACTHDFDSFDFNADAGSGAGTSSGGTGAAAGTGGTGATAGNCGNGTTACAGSCVNTDTHEKHCGACNSVCAGGLSCEDGRCGCAQPSQCGGDGADCRNDRCRCKGNSCRDGESCLGTGDNARCSCNGGDDCDGGETCCASGCVDLDDDDKNCGACGVTCAVGQECGNGRCQD